VVCLNFQPPPGFVASMEEPMGVGSRLDEMAKSKIRREPIVARTRLQDPEKGTWSASPAVPVIKNADGVTELTLEEDEEEARQDGRWIAPFLACGDLTAFDADASYHLPKDRVSLDPVQPPTAPPYKRALEMRKAAGGAYGKTSSK